MEQNRRQWLKRSALGAGAAPFAQRASASELGAKLEQAMESTVLKRDLFRDPVIIESVELIRSGKHYMVRVRSKGGVTGYSDAHSSVMSVAYPILLKRVAPSFAGKDARDLETLLRAVYVPNSNYKWQGLAFWVPVAAVEIATLDLLGKVAGQPIGELLGGVVRREIPVYRASEKRGNSPEEEIAYLQQLVAETGAKAIKFRLGARMRYDDASTGRDLRLIPLTRKTFGEKMTIYADANGSYDVPMAVRIGRLMEEQRYGFFEEPVPFDYYDETKKIADTLTIPIALGEVEMSLRIPPHHRNRNGPSDPAGSSLFWRVDPIHQGSADGASRGTRLYAPHVGRRSRLPVLRPLRVLRPERRSPPGVQRWRRWAAGGIATSSLKAVDGKVKAPAGPGLGINLDPQLLKNSVVV